MEEKNTINPNTEEQEEQNLNTEEQEEQIPNTPKWEMNKKVIIIGLCIGIVLLLAVAQVVGKALNKPKDKAQQEQVLNDTMLEAQKQMGDDFYNAASGGEPIPSEQGENQTASGEMQGQNQEFASENGETAPAKIDEKLVTVNLNANVGRVDPFVPMVNYGRFKSSDLPQLPNISYPAPPTELVVNEPAIKLMETTISGIMYDAIAPSAIIKVEGQDYLVRKGDRINGYKVLNITKDRVVVQNGTNVYRATVGETITTTKGSVTFNTVDNLTNKFGGASAPKGTRIIEIN